MIAQEDHINLHGDQNIYAIDIGFYDRKLGHEEKNTNFYTEDKSMPISSCKCDKGGCDLEYSNYI